MTKKIFPFKVGGIAAPIVVGLFIALAIIFERPSYDDFLNMTLGPFSMIAAISTIGVLATMVVLFILAVIKKIKK